MLKQRTVTCPRCGAIIEVTNPNLMLSREINCPNPKCKAVLHIQFDNGETVFVDSKNKNKFPGFLKYEGNDHAGLKEGRNTIGRADRKRTADIGINTQDMSMSRLHCVIEVVKQKSGKYKVIISDARDLEKIDVKPIFVNNEMLSSYDKILLEDGDNIKLGNTIVKYIQN